VGYPGTPFRALVYFINVDKVAKEIRIESLVGKAFELHPVHTNPAAADKRIALEARFDATSGTFNFPARSAAVFVLR
jgi:hypothetical protein